MELEKDMKQIWLKKEDRKERKKEKRKGMKEVVWKESLNKNRFEFEKIPQSSVSDYV